MDPEKRFTCAQLLQHQYFDGFVNEFEREKKEQIKHIHREQQKLLQQQQQQQAKLQSNVYVTGAGQTKQSNPGGVSLIFLFFSLIQKYTQISILYLSKKYITLKTSVIKNAQFLNFFSISHPFLAIKIVKETIHQRPMIVVDAIFIYQIYVRA